MGLPGFPNDQTFVLLDHRPGSVFRWLQSCDTPGLAFVVIDPLVFVPEYPIEKARSAASFVGLDHAEELIVLVICTVPPPPAEPTANFLAPIAIGQASRRGAQVVLHDSGYTSAATFLRRS